MDQVTRREKAFYEDQKSKRECRLSEEIDEEFEEEKQELLEKEREKEEQLSQEISFIMEDDVESEVLDDSIKCFLNSNLNRSGVSGNTKEYSDKNVQTEKVYQERTKICKIRDCTNAAKTTCVNLSVKCDMSAEMSRVYVQTICKDLYDHNYFLSKD